MKGSPEKETACEKATQSYLGAFQITPLHLISLRAHTSPDGTDIRKGLWIQAHVSRMLLVWGDRGPLLRNDSLRKSRGYLSSEAISQDQEHDKKQDLSQQKQG